jgi:hypothetical protein
MLSQIGPGRAPSLPHVLGGRHLLREASQRAEGAVEEARLVVLKSLSSADLATATPGFAGRR